MFTGIIEDVGTLVEKKSQGTNVDFWVASSLSNALKIDQSIAHNGVCLTVVEQRDGQHRVTLIKESLERSNLGEVPINGKLNLERCLKADGRLDGHMVQGHVDTVGTIQSIRDEKGSFVVRIHHPKGPNYLTVEKGSICVNGVSLTVVESGEDFFSIALIPFTWEHTNFYTLSVGDSVNLEFDILGKYMQKLLSRHQ